MAVSSKMFGQFLLKAMNKEVSVTSGCTNLKVMLLTSAQATAFRDGTAQDTWVNKSAITSEISGTGYTAGGATLTSVTVTYYSTVSGTIPANSVVIDAADVVWSSSTITAQFAVVYDSTSTNYPLICFVDFGQDMSSSNGNFNIQWDSAGICNITAA